MSRVDQTELIEGDVADAASFNATLTSWNLATAAGAVSKDNFTEEGLDLRVFQIGSIKRPYQGSDDYSGGSLSTPGFVTDSATYVPVHMGTDAVIGPFDLSKSNRRLRVRASFLVRTVLHVVPGPAFAAERVDIRLARSSDNVTFTEITGTYRVFMGRSSNTPYAQAAFEQSCTIATSASSIGSSATTYVRLEVRIQNGAFVDVNCVSLYGEVFNK